MTSRPGAQFTQNRSAARKRADGGNRKLKIENLPLVISIADDQFSMTNCQSTLPNLHCLQNGFVPKGVRLTGCDTRFSKSDESCCLANKAELRSALHDASRSPCASNVPTGLGARRAGAAFPLAPAGFQWADSSSTTGIESRPILITINFTAMADGHQIEVSLNQIKAINHAVIAGSQSVLVRACHAIMRECRQAQTHGINLSLDESLNLRRKAEEIIVEFS